MPISPDTYRLIAAAITDEGLEYNGERIPLVRENREKIAAAVKTLRAKGGSAKMGPAVLDSVRIRLDALLDEARAVANQSGQRLELIGLLEEGGESLRAFAQVLRENTLVLK